MRHEPAAPANGTVLELLSTPPTPRHARHATFYGELPAARTDPQDERKARTMTHLTDRDLWDRFADWADLQADIRLNPQAKRTIERNNPCCTKQGIETSWGVTDYRGKLAAALWRIRLGIETTITETKAAQLADARNKLHRSERLRRQLEDIAHTEGLTFWFDHQHDRYRPGPPPEPEPDRQLDLFHIAS